MSLYKTVLKLFAVSTLAGISLSANAGIFGPDLDLANHVNLPSTTRINGGTCSSIIPKLGGAGITQNCAFNHVDNNNNAYADNIIAGYMVYAACWANETNCVADLFMTDNCDDTDKTAKPIAQVTFDYKQGVKSVVMYDDSTKPIYNPDAKNYKIDYLNSDKFYVTLSRIDDQYTCN